MRWMLSPLVWQMWAWCMTRSPLSRQAASHQQISRRIGASHRPRRRSANPK
jgi:hypothetical protein